MDGVSDTTTSGSVTAAGDVSETASPLLGPGAGTGDGVGARTVAAVCAVTSSSPDVDPENKNVKYFSLNSDIYQNVK